MRLLSVFLAATLFLGALQSGCAVITAEEKAQIEARLKEVENRQATVEDQAETRRQRIEERFADLENAIGELRTGLAAGAGNEEVLARLIEIEKTLGKQAKTIAGGATPVSLKSQPGQPPSELEQARALLEKGKAIEAREVLQRLEHTQLPEGAASLITLLVGESYYLEKNYHEAILAFHKVVEMDPPVAETPQAMLREAQSFALLGKHENAAFLFRKLLSDYPGSEQAEQVRKELEGME